MISLQQILLKIKDLKHDIKCFCQRLEVVEDTVSSGENMANTDLVADGDHTIDYSGNAFSINSLDDFSFISEEKGKLDVSDDGVFLSGNNSIPTFIGTTSSGDISIYPDNDSATVGIGISSTDKLTITNTETTASTLIKYNDDKSADYDNRTLVDKEYVDTTVGFSIPTRTGTVIAFDKSSVYNDFTTPGTGDITFDFTGAVENTEVVLYHNGSTPTFPTEAIVVGAYYSGNNNIIRLIYRSNSEVDISIFNTNSSYINPSTTLQPSGDQSTISATASDITGMTFTVEANSVYKIDGAIKYGTSTTNGSKFTVDSPSGTLYISVIGDTTSGTVFSRYAIPSSTTLSPTMGAHVSSGHEVLWNGTITIGGTGGPLYIMYAAAIGGGGDTTTIYQEGSYMTLTKF